jgi:prolipoprotein diacylglyceryltransferase
VEAGGVLLVHSIFDALAFLVALAVYRLVPVAALGMPPEPWRVHSLYIAAGSVGATVGAYLAGSANLWLTGIGGVARSIEGAIAGGIIGIEILKWRTGIRGSTGLRFVAPLAAAIAVGRIGCFFAGLEDMTYGTPTALPWGHDFGDGILRHPVQLYESMAMAAFAVFYVVEVFRRDDFVVTNGFYLALAYYGLQRFLWEFLKPYGAVIGPLTLFHLLSLFILFYALVMLATATPARLKHERAAA